MYYCPTCGGTEFEERGNVRCYIKLDSDLEENGWSTPIETLEVDHNDLGETIVYCLHCDSQFTKTALEQTESNERQDPPE